MRFPPTRIKALWAPSKRVLNPPDNITPLQGNVILEFVFSFWSSAAT
jgi:hypothetical protein